ncbi:uncharacterized protein RB166_018144 isoform 2-T2 [Leptodactylus fuscus]|uniref:uncharacterized protein LOC142219313 isoform X2 n=1 Tax=Leptodactylus fuscus TaxID=238119 RepID=UPI003F4F2661
MESTSHSGLVHYEPPRYSIATGSQSSHVHSGHTLQWNNDSPPPSYDTIDRLPTWDEEQPYLYPSPTAQVWIQRTENNEPSTSQISNIPPSIQQAPSPPSPSQSISPELSGLSSLSHQSAAGPQTTDLKQSYRRFRPTVLGIVLIIVFFLEISLGISMVPSSKNHNMNSLLYGTLFWVPWFHIVAGTMLIWSWASTSVSSVKCVLYFGMLSCIASVIGLVFNSYDLHHLHCVSYIHDFTCGRRHGNDTEIVIFCCLVGLNILAVFLTLVASCIGSATLAKSSPPTYVITVTSSR